VELYSIIKASISSIRILLFTAMYFLHCKVMWPMQVSKFAWVW